MQIKRSNGLKMARGRGQCLTSALTMARIMWKRHHPGPMEVVERSLLKTAPSRNNLKNSNLPHWRQPGNMTPDMM